ncbi:SHOCT domain-containing protein [Pseudoxanthomonas suwonensis]
MKWKVFLVLLVVVFQAEAKDPVAVGEGRYMLTHKGKTIFSSADKIVADLMGQAHKFCQRTTGHEANLLESSGQEAQVGRAGGALGTQPAQGAVGTIYFSCGPATGSGQTAGDRGDIYESLARLKGLLDSGAISQSEFDAEKEKLLQSKGH